MIIVVFGQVRFHHTTKNSAVFTHVSGLRAGNSVRAAGEVGKVAKVTLDRRGRAQDFDRGSPAVTGSATTASIRYLNLIGDPVPELAVTAVSGWCRVPRSRLSTPIRPWISTLCSAGFRPLFQTLTQTRSTARFLDHHRVPRHHHQRHPRPDRLLTATLADRDHAIGEVVNNLEHQRPPPSHQRT